ncbi:MAG: phosphoglycerate dehydrogenase [Myxococcota bacterium]
MSDAMRILLMEGVHPAGRALLEDAGFQVEYHDRALEPAEFLEHIGGFHAIGIRSKTLVTPEVLSRADRLLAVGAFCIGTNQVALDAANHRGIPVFNAPYSSTRSVAELVVAEMIALSRQLGHISHAAHHGLWKKTARRMHEVRGKTVGIIGYGHIGSQVGILAEAFGMRVVYYDTVKKLPLGNAAPAALLGDLLAQADFVTLHVPATDETHEMFGAPELAAMKEGAYLLNLSRGTVVQIPALVDALKRGHIHGAAIDVFPNEPPSVKDPFASELQGLDNVILTPHIGGSTEEAQEAIGRESAEALMRYLHEGSSGGAVNFPNVELPTRASAHRLLNVHRNVPGVLSQINRLVSESGANILGQYLSTDPEIGYLVMDVETERDGLRIAEAIRGLEHSIKTRRLY